MVPIILGLEFNAYSTSTIGDNCGWIASDVDAFIINT
jgi:hypothetical protein